MNDLTPHQPTIQLIETYGEPTVRDVDLAERLGLKRPTNIRHQVIERHRAEIESYGVLHQIGAKSDDPLGRGRPATEYHLTEEQALCVCALSRAPKAPSVRRMLIEVFTAYRRGHLVPELDRNSVGGIVKAVVRKALAEALTEMLPAMLESRLATDPKMVAAADYIPAVQVAIDRKVNQKGRRRIVCMISNRLSRFCEDHNYRVRRDWSGRKLFDRAAVRHWLADGGWVPIKDLIEHMAGQSRLRLVPPRPEG